jgi:hypothetical protein
MADAAVSEGRCLDSALESAAIPFIQSMAEQTVGDA